MENPFILRKRSREEFDQITTGLVLLSGGQNKEYLDLYGRVFECKTCNRQFSSFQALGGHRASHKRPRMVTAGAGDVMMSSLPPPPPQKPKTHECSICGLEFAIGQALGGHMRRHRAATAANETLHGGDALALCPPPGGVSLVKKPSGGRRVLCVDLNLTPVENDLEFFKLGKVV